MLLNTFSILEKKTDFIELYILYVSFLFIFWVEKNIYALKKYVNFSFTFRSFNNKTKLYLAKSTWCNGWTAASM